MSSAVETDRIESDRWRWEEENHPDRCRRSDPMNKTPLATVLNRRRSLALAASIRCKRSATDLPWGPKRNGNEEKHTLENRFSSAQKGKRDVSYK